MVPGILVFLRTLLLTVGVLMFHQASALADGFDLENWFSGKTYAYGKFSAINGTTQRFKVELTGRIDGSRFTLREDFVYADGERDTKTWVFQRLDARRLTATREDVVAPTTVYERADGVVDFTYRVDLEPGDERNVVRFFDRITMQADETIRNTALVTKYGLPVARVAVNFARTPEQARAIRP